MPVTDLTGTTWVFDGFSVEYLTDSYDISFQSNGNSYIKYEWEADTVGEDEYDIYWVKYYSSESSFIYAYQNGDWTNEAYATITITGGTDATSSSPYFADLLDFLETNATQVPSGNTYTFINTLTNITHGNVSFIVELDSGYQLPSSSSSITVTNGTLVSYDNTTGEIVVNGDNVEISISCEEIPSGYNVTLTPGPYGPDESYVYTIYDGQDDTGEELGTVSYPNSITVTIASGYMCIAGGSNGLAIEDTGTLTGGVSWVSGPDNSLGREYMTIYSVSGDGSVSGFEWGCFVEGTQITLADGTTKAIENITYDDVLLVYNLYEGKLTSAKPTWIMRERIASHYKKIVFSDGTILKLVGEGENCHRLFNVTKQKFLYANECVGDEVYKQDGSIVTVVSCEKIDEKVKYYNLTTERYYDCFANGVLTGSRLNNMHHISNMKYDSDERLISEEEEEERWAIRERLRRID